MLMILLAFSNLCRVKINEKQNLETYHYLLRDEYENKNLI